MIEATPRGHIKNFIYDREDLEKMTTKQLIGFIRHIGTWHRMYFRDWRYDDDYVASEDNTETEKYGARNNEELADLQ